MPNIPAQKKQLPALLLIFLAAAGLTTVFFRPADIFRNTPILSDDYSMHYANCLAAKEFWLNHGRCWGYDPFLLAGFPRCTLVNADNKFWEIVFTCLSPLVGNGAAFKLYVVLFLVFFPAFFYFSARNFGLTRPESTTAALLGLMCFYLSLPHDLALWGMIAYVVACFFSLLVLSFFYRLLHSFTAGTYILLTLSAAVLFSMHVLSPIHVVVPALLLYGFNLKRLSPAQHLLLLVSLCIVVLLNSFWLIPIYEFFDYKTSRPENYEFTLQIKNIFEPLNVYIRQQHGIAPHSPVLNNTMLDTLLLVCALAGMYSWRRQQKRTLFWAFLCGVAAIFFVTFYGSHTPFFAQFQPQRFAVPLIVLCVLPAAPVLHACITGIFHNRKPATIVFLTCLLLVVFYRPFLRPFGIYYKHRTHRLKCDLPQPAIELMDFFRDHTSKRGRILIEDSESFTDKNGKYFPEAYYGMHLTGLFPEQVKRQYLCGPRPMYPIKHSFASFNDGILFEKPVGTYTLPELQRYFSLFNVKWVVCWHENSNALFEAFPGYITRVRQIDKFTIYEVNRSPSYFLKGAGHVEVDYNLLRIENIVPEEGEIIISYHWLEHLQAIPPARIERVFLEEDPVGFIKIVSPPENLVLRNSYRRGGGTGDRPVAPASNVGATGRSPLR